jgi:hypothetical protein
LVLVEQVVEMNCKAQMVAILFFHPLLLQAVAAVAAKAHKQG